MIDVMSMEEKEFDLTLTFPVGKGTRQWE